MKRFILTILGLSLSYAPFSIGAPQTTPTAPAQQQTTTNGAVTTQQNTTTNGAVTTTNSAAATPQTATTTPTQAQTQPQTVDKGKASYSIGVDLGENFKAEGIEVDPDMLLKGLKDSMSNIKLIYTKQEMEATLIAFQKQLAAKRQANLAMLATKNDQAGTAYLAANKAKPGVVTTASGLQYKVITPGSGAHPTDTDIVTVDYTGNFINGQEFDSSYKHGKPVTFPVTEVIPGWVEAIKLMQPGAIYEVVVPYNLAYGERGLGTVIGPKQTLIFKIHLLSVKPASEPKTTT